MRIFKTLVIREFMLHLLDKRVMVYTGVCLLLICGSFILQTREYRARYRSHLQVDGAYGKQWNDTKYRTMHQYKVFTRDGYFRSYKPSPLQVFCRGTESYPAMFAGVALNMWNGNRAPLWRGERIRNPFLGFFLHLDFSVIVTFVLSLLVLIFSYGAVSGEREDGTLKMVLANPVSRAAVLLAKLVSGYLVILVPLAVSWLLCMLTAGFLPFFRLSMTETAASGVLFLLASLYLMVLYGCGILCSTLIRRSGTVIAVLLMVWLIFIVGLHNVTLLVAERIIPPKRADQVSMEFHHKSGEIWRNYNQGVQKKYGKPYHGLDEMQKMEAYTGYLDATHRGMTEILQKYIDANSRSYRMLRLTGLLSPSLLFTAAATDVAGTGIEGYLHHMRDLIRELGYLKKNAVGQMKIDLLFPGGPTAMGRYAGQKDLPRIATEFERYKPRPQSLSERLGAALFTILVLGCYAVLIFMVSFLVFIKKDVA